MNRLDQRARYPSLAIPSPTYLAPIDERSPVVARLEKISILTPTSAKKCLPSPGSPHLPYPSRSDSIPRSEPLVVCDGLPTPEPAREHSPVKRPSVPSTPTSQKLSSTEFRDQLRAWGHVYYGNAKTADAFVVARSMRHHSSPLVGTGNDSPKLRGTNRLTVRAIIHPRITRRQSFLIQRSFDIDELRSTVPDPSPMPARVERTPTSASPRTPSFASLRGRRSSSIKTSAVLSGRDYRSSVSLDFESLMRDAKAVPIHQKYARAYLPVLAALLVSGHVREGDVIYLPLPCAEAWPATVRYIYTGQGDLTEAVKENILYLAGKV